MINIGKLEILKEIKREVFLFATKSPRRITCFPRFPLFLCRFLESLKIVRRKHCVAFRRSWKAGLSRISQLDMALTQFGFVGFTLLCGDYLGVNNSFEELEGLIHLWRVVGSMLGMEDKFVHQTQILLLFEFLSYFVLLQVKINCNRNYFLKQAY